MHGYASSMKCSCWKRNCHAVPACCVVCVGGCECAEPGGVRCSASPLLLWWFPVALWGCTLGLVLGAWRSMTSFAQRCHAAVLCQRGRCFHLRALLGGGACLAISGVCCTCMPMSDPRHLACTLLCLVAGGQPYAAAVCCHLYGQAVPGMCLSCKALHCQAGADHQWCGGNAGGQGPAELTAAGLLGSSRANAHGCVGWVGSCCGVVSRLFPWRKHSQRPAPLVWGR
jgi:hypothetical protein